MLNAKFAHWNRFFFSCFKIILKFIPESKKQLRFIAKNYWSNLCYYFLISYHKISISFTVRIFSFSFFKTMGQPDHVTSIVATTVCKVSQKLITKIDFQYQIGLLGSFSHVYLVPKIHFSYYFTNNLTYCHCN